MPTHQFSESADIAAPPQLLYDIIADYQDGHGQIVPKPPFVSIDVEKGGVGAGTVIHVRIKVLGQVQGYHATITEPEPGRVLVETNDNGYVTSFIVEPRENGQAAHVTISTEMPLRTGIVGRIERWFMMRFLRPVYIKELEQLAAVAAAKA